MSSDSVPKTPTRIIQLQQRSGRTPSVAQRRRRYKYAADRRRRAEARQRLERARTEIEAAAELFPGIVVVRIDDALTAVVEAEKSLP